MRVLTTKFVFCIKLEMPCVYLSIL